MHRHRREHAVAPRSVRQRRHLQRDDELDRAPAGTALGCGGPGQNESGKSAEKNKTPFQSGNGSPRFEWRGGRDGIYIACMSGGRLRAAILLALGAALMVAGVSQASPAPAGSGSANVRIEFTGKGGGRYLDITRWLREDTRECYARRTADETVAVSWKVVWTAKLVAKEGRWTLVAPKQQVATVAGSVTGSAVRDSCDAAEEEPDWNGTSVCKHPLPVRSDGGVMLSLAGRLHVRGPVFGSPGSGCELEVRNDQLQAHLLAPGSLLNLVQTGKPVAVPVGTRHPTPADAYVATQFCSAFPHIYEGVVYLYDCLDTLIWNGQLSVSRA